MCDGFRVGLTGEGMAFREQPRLQSLVILDNPVVGNRKLAGRTEVWVGVGLIGLAVGSPSGMAYREIGIPDIGQTFEPVGQLRFKAGDLARRLDTEK